MTDREYQPITMSRRSSAPADEIIHILADPRNHLTLDGPGMLREVASGTVIRGVGDVFLMRMYFTELGDYPGVSASYYEIKGEARAHLRHVHPQRMTFHDRRSRPP